MGEQPFTAVERAHWWAINEWLTVATFPAVLILLAFVCWLIFKRR
jgi:hypothetical protein